MYTFLLRELVKDTDHLLRDPVLQLLECPPGSRALGLLDDSIELAYSRLKVEKSHRWLRLYTDASIIRSAADFIIDEPDCGIATAAVARLDRAIIISGAAGNGRHAMILDMIHEIQTKYLPLESRPDVLPYCSPRFVSSVSTALTSVPRLSEFPSFVSFQRQHAHHPFILPGYALDWPALSNHSWRSRQYLRSVAGPGRLVPVEVGIDYRTDDWAQALMDWDEFLDSLTSDEGPPLYLAQHSLFLQLPRLREDIVIPDYVYACPDQSKHFPHYRPPGNDEQLVLNAWFGPKGTISPAHTDPYHNFYAQIVGRKTVWLAPSYHTESMYPYIAEADSSHAPHNPAANNQNPSMSNTSKVDVFTPAKEAQNEYSTFWAEVVPEAMTATLEPGDLLFFPPGWWHAFRSEEVSFSVSMWF